MRRITCAVFSRKLGLRFLGRHDRAPCLADTGATVTTRWPRVAIRLQSLAANLTEGAGGPLAHDHLLPGEGETAALTGQVASTIGHCLHVLFRKEQERSLAIYLQSALAPPASMN